MSLFVDTSVWSLALRRDEPVEAPHVARLREALSSGDAVYTTGLVLQDLLQGFAGPRARDAIIQRFASLPLVVPDRNDHVAAAEIRNECRRNGVQLGTIDALLLRMGSRHDLWMMTTDRDFEHASRHVSLKLWRPPA